MIRSIAFNGVQVHGLDIPVHGERAAGSEGHLLYEFHHTAIHQGSIDDPWKHGTPLDVTTMLHGPFIAGTTTKNTTFGKFGIRLRPEAAVFDCIHARNSGEDRVEFVAHYTIDYEILTSAIPDDRSLQIAFANVNILPVQSKDPTRGLPVSIKFYKSVKIQGVGLHHHPWLKEVRIYVAGGSISKYPFQRFLAAVIEGSKSDDGHLHWFEAGIQLGHGDYLHFDITGAIPQGNAQGSALSGSSLGSEMSIMPIALSVLFTCDDGSDHTPLLSDVAFRAFTLIIGNVNCHPFCDVLDETSGKVVFTGIAPPHEKHLGTLAV